MAPPRKKPTPKATPAQGQTKAGPRAAKAKKPAPKRTKSQVGKGAPRTITKPKRNGRPTKLEDVSPTLVALLAIGVSVEAACGEAGISERAFYRWMEKGEDVAALVAEGYDVSQEELGFLQFRQDAHRASNRMEIDAVRELRKRLPEASTRELLDVLGRKNRRSWGRQDSLQVNHSGTVNVDVVQRYGETIAELLRGVLGDLGLSDEQRKRAPEVVKLWMERLTAKEPT